MDLKRYLADRQKQVDRALDRFLPKASVPPATLHKAMRYSLFAGGKRLRPILCLAAAEACGGKTAAALPHACAMECIHTYSLIHDDLPSMDNDDLRRGRPTCHKVFGDGIAILAGDALLTIAFEIATQARPVRRYDLRDVLREISVAAGSRKLIAGQVLDLEAEGRRINRAQLRSIHENKTAALVTASIRLGAMSANANPKATRGGHRVRSRPGARVPGHRRHSRCDPDLGETRQERWERCGREQSDLSGRDRFGQIASGSAAVDCESAWRARIARRKRQRLTRAR
jgi:geranylgeranyl diphosphate synthase type II